MWDLIDQGVIVYINAILIYLVEIQEPQGFEFEVLSYLEKWNRAVSVDK
jgi:hypothetical protein